MKPERTKNRWWIAASAVAIHISIGSVYAYSAWKMPLENTFGWKATQTTFAFSTAIFFLGLSAAFLGRIVEKKGPTFAGIGSALFFCTGLIGSGVGCRMENYPVFLFSFGVIGGIGLGLGYIAPVSTLVKWFPDRRGLATGLAIMGFGFGGLVCAKLVATLVPATAEIVIPLDQPVHMWQKGPKKGSALTSEQKKKKGSALTSEHFRSPNSERENVQMLGLTPFATPSAPSVNEFRANSDAYPELHTAVLYDPQTISRAFWILGGVYLVVMIPGALYISPPSKQKVSAPTSAHVHSQNAEGKNVHVLGGTPSDPEFSASEALRTPAFYGMWLILFLNVACGIALIATAKKMGYEMVKLPEAAATTMVMGISLFNGFGRILWASFSDRIGRANTYIAFFLIQIIAFPVLAHLTSTPWAFLAVTFLILTCYGGGFACIPAYISDVFGLKAMPTIHGMILTAWSMAGLLGPMLNSQVYERTHDYRMSLYIFGGACGVALLTALWMKGEIRRMSRTAVQGVGELENLEIRQIGS